ncbi:MAG: hypothetical protein ABSG93_08185 [Solirubrobacteraceae bacterium]|jgi:hypothetical protein
MKLRSRNTPPSFTGQFKDVSVRDRRRLVGHLRDGLERLADRVGQPYVNVSQIQLVIQVCGAASFQGWREAHESTWRRQSDKYTTRGWPLQLPAGYCGMVLLPLPAGRVATTARDHPPLLATPMFAHGPLLKRSGYYDAALRLITSWVANPGFGVTARLAPPIIETIALDRIVERRVEPFGVDWPLPAAEGLS